MSLEAFGLLLLTDPDQERPGSFPVVFRIDPIAVPVGIPSPEYEPVAGRDHDLVDHVASNLPSDGKNPSAYRIYRSELDGLQGHPVIPLKFSS